MFEDHDRRRRESINASLSFLDTASFMGTILGAGRIRPRNEQISSLFPSISIGMPAS